jgi:glucosamine--fructose-6-phosphate aminotransferase (isomerizing)
LTAGPCRPGAAEPEIHVLPECEGFFILNGEYAMCGIVGYIGPKKVTRLLLDGLKRLEYRGYDSAGVAIIDGGEVKITRSKGKLAVLEDIVSNDSFDGHVGLGHTRWATHGGVTNENAHPHVSHDARISVVHNGVIENYSVIKRELEAKGITFSSETDSEVLVNNNPLNTAVDPSKERTHNI